MTNLLAQSFNQIRKSSPGRSIVLGLIVFGGVAWASQDVPAPAAAGASVGVPSVAPSEVVPSSLPDGLATPVQITPAEGKKLLHEFTRAQSSELRALEHRQKLEMRELKASQSARQKEWENKERDARHKYFEEHRRGPERRAYIKDFMERRKGLLQAMSEEKTQRAHAQEVRVKSLKEDQSARLKEFQAAIKRGERPPEKLWPSPG